MSEYTALLKPYLNDPGGSDAEVVYKAARALEEAKEKIERLRGEVEAAQQDWLTAHEHALAMQQDRDRLLALVVAVADGIDDYWAENNPAVAAACRAEAERDRG